MRVPLVLAAIVVFGAIWIVDTEALLRLTVYCVGGGCGVRPMWIAIAAAGIAVAAIVLLRQPRAEVRVARVAKKGPSRPSRGKAATRRKAK
jgi:hypothetical protein